MYKSIILNFILTLGGLFLFADKDPKRVVLLLIFVFICIALNVWTGMELARDE